MVLHNIVWVFLLLKGKLPESLNNEVITSKTLLNQLQNYLFFSQMIDFSKFQGLYNSVFQPTILDILKITIFG